MVTAKLVLNSKLESGSGDNRNVVCAFSANYSDGKNAEWAVWTPNAQITMMMKGQVADKFVIDQEYTVTFTPSTPE